MLGDKPLIAYSVLAASKSKLITHTIVSTDDPEIAEAAKKYGADVPFMRPKEIAQDMTPHVPVMQHAIDFMEKKLGIVFDYTVIFQPTSPFRLTEDIDGTLNILIDSKADSAVSLVKADSHEHPIKMKKLEGTKVVPYCIPEPEGIGRQGLSPVYRRSSAVYAMRRDIIIKNSKLFGDNIVGYVVPEERSIDIDTPFDWIKAEYMLQDLKNKGYTW